MKIYSRTCSNGSRAAAALRAAEAAATILEDEFEFSWLKFERPSLFMLLVIILFDAGDRPLLPLF